MAPHLLLGGRMPDIPKQIVFMVLSWYLSLLMSRALCSMVELTTTSAIEGDNLGGCVQLFTCRAGPIQGNLFWYATFGSGLELRFARNDGGNAETNPPYNQITLEGVTDYHTRVSRTIINDDLFIDFDSTLAFDVLHSLQSNLTGISCGSFSANSSIIAPLVPQFNDLNYDISQTLNSSGYIYECTGVNVPLTLRIGNCSINNTNSVLKWIVNDSQAVQYAFDGNNLEVMSGNSSEFYTKSLERFGDKLNFTSGFKVKSDTQCISLQCGSNLVSSKEVFHAPGTPNVMISVLYEDSATEFKAEWNALEPLCSEITYIYEAVLKNATGAVVQTLLKKCSMQICDVLFRISQVYGVFILEVKAYIDGQDTEAGTFISDLINATRMEQLNVSFSVCLTSITCNADLLGTCAITFKDGNNFNVTVHGQINEPISLPKFEMNVNYSYTASFNDIYIFHGNFIGVKSNPQGNHNSYVGVGVTCLIVGFIIQTVGCILLLLQCTKYGISNFGYLQRVFLWIILHGMSWILAIVSLSLWISYGVVNDSGSCTSGPEEYIAIIATAMSVILMVISIVITGALLLVGFMCERKKPPKEKEPEKISYDRKYKLLFKNEYTTMISDASEVHNCECGAKFYHLRALDISSVMFGTTVPRKKCWTCPKNRCENCIRYAFRKQTQRLVQVCEVCYKGFEEEKERILKLPKLGVFEPVTQNYNDICYECEKRTEETHEVENCKGCGQWVCDKCIVTKEEVYLQYSNTSEYVCRNCYALIKIMKVSLKPAFEDHYKVNDNVAYETQPEMMEVNFMSEQKKDIKEVKGELPSSTQLKIMQGKGDKTEENREESLDSKL